jgi:hypothetical protein
MICSNCNVKNPAGLRFCEQCATPFKKPCAQCGFQNSAGARFCGACATPLDIAPLLTSEPAAVPSAGVFPNDADTATLDGERKTVTALFADIKGSTALMEEMDPEAARDY